ncbi:MAG: MarR family transcriptional regulator [Alphaproteobacteria bacterium]|nr:MarR family transcriptional regulator [Alphaproteobacteria bacterium]
MADAALLGCLIGVAANMDAVGLVELKKHGLTQTEHDVLACARRQTPSFIATPGKLLEEVRITSGALSICINRLLERGLVRRVSSEEDQRSKPIQLTGSGIALIDEVTEYRFNLAGTIVKVLSATEKSTLKSLLLKLQGAIEKS